MQEQEELHMCQYVVARHSEHLADRNTGAAIGPLSLYPKFSGRNPFRNPSHTWIALQIIALDGFETFIFGLEKYPAHMTPKEPFSRGVAGG